MQLLLLLPPLLSRRGRRGFFLEKGERGGGVGGDGSSVGWDIVGALIIERLPYASTVECLAVS